MKIIDYCSDGRSIYLQNLSWPWACIHEASLSLNKNIKDIYLEKSYLLHGLSWLWSKSMSPADDRDPLCIVLRTPLTLCIDESLFCLGMSLVPWNEYERDYLLPSCQITRPTEKALFCLWMLLAILCTLHISKYPVNKARSIEEEILTLSFALQPILPTGETRDHFHLHFQQFSRCERPQCVLSPLVCPFCKESAIVFFSNHKRWKDYKPFN